MDYASTAEIGIMYNATPAATSSSNSTGTANAPTTAVASPSTGPSSSTDPPGSTSAQASSTSTPGGGSAMNQRPATSPEQRKASHSGPHGLNARSCVICRKRKVKCDKQIPCSNCLKAGSQCVFPAPGRAPRRPRQGGKVVSEREAELLKRLRRLEGVVEELSGQVELEATKQSPSSEHSSMQKDNDSNPDSIIANKSHTVRVVGMDEGAGTKKSWLSRNFMIGSGPPKSDFSLEQATQGVGRLVLDEGKTRYYASPFWASITEEVDEIRELIEDQDFGSDSDTPVLPSDVVTDPDHQSFIMGYSSSDVNLKSLHPLPSQISFYWQTFLENVHPLTKIIHEPTMSKVIKEVKNNLDSLEKSTEALMFSIYFATITSMSGDEVRTNFGLEKNDLSKQYRFGTEQALARAGFLNTNEIVTLQALVLFLVCVRRHDDSRFVWSLTGLAMRISQSLGLHKDGSKFGIAPFDTEMRRRLWWQICILDMRASEDYGSEPSIVDYSFDTEFPLSLNDEDWSPTLKEAPKPRPGVSDMTFCLIRYEICAMARKLTYVRPGPSPSKDKKGLTFEESEELIRSFSKHLEDKYLRYCEDAGPLYWVAATVARLIIAKMTLMIYQPLTQPGQLSNLSQDVKDRIFMSSIEIIEYAHLLETEASTKHWGWLFHTYVQWHAIAYILGELSVRSNSAIAERAWRAIDGVFKDWGGAARNSKTGMLWQPMRKLMARARLKREENLRNAPNKNLELGMNGSIVRAPPQGYAQGNAYPTSIPINNNIQQQNTTNNTSTVNQQPSFYSRDVPRVETQNVAMGMLAPDQVQIQLQQQQLAQQQAGQQAVPWLMDDNALLDLDMSAVDGDVNWEGWDDLVRDFQMQTDAQMRDTDMGRAPAFNSMSNWW